MARYGFPVELAAGSGELTCEWNRDWLLRSVKWSHAGNGPGLTTNSSDQVQLLDIPPEWRDFFSGLSRFFSQGDPLPIPPWTLLDQSGWTEFQAQVFLATARVPHGETRPYSWISKKLGRLYAHRAVGQALRSNPLLLVVPCHRIVTAEGKLGGFMGQDEPGAPELLFKSVLLDLEHRYRNPMFPFASGL